MQTPNLFGGYMADEKSGLAKGLLIGLIAGGVVGALIGLLYAPKPGKELRSDIKRKAGSMAEDAGEYIKTATMKGKEIVSQGMSKSEKLISETKEKAGHILDDAEKMLTGIRERAGGETGKIKAAFRAGMDAYKDEQNRDAT
jgi:gas vesicle protein